MRGLNKEKVASLKNAFILTQEKKMMFKMRHKQKLVRRLIAFSAAGLILLGIMLSGIFSQSASLKAKEQELADKKEKLAALEDQQKLSEEELIRLKDDEYIADIARRDYFLSDDGEVIFNIPELEEKEKNTEP